MKRSLRSKNALSAALAMLVVASAGGLVHGQTGRPRYSSPPNDRAGVVPEGTVISMRMDATLTSRTSHVGDKFTATVAIPVYVDGKTAIPAGSVVEGQVTSVTPAKRMSKSGTIAVDFDDLIFPDGTRVKLSGSLTAADPNDRSTIDQEGRVSGSEGNRKVVFIGGGGAVGAVLGGIASRSAGGAILGGVLGAGAGVGAVMLSKGEEAEVRAGTPFGIQLTQAIPVGDSSTSEGGAEPNRAPDRASSQGGSFPNRTSDRDYGRGMDRGSSPPADRGSASSPDRDSGPPPERDSNPPADRSPNRDARADRDAADSTASRNPAANPGDTGSNPDSSAAAQPAATDSGSDQPLSSPEMIRRAQSALKDQGYYEGDISGVMTPRTSNAIRSYQRDHQLNQTGDLDPATARSLGIVGVQPSGGARPNTNGSGNNRTASPDDSDIANPRSGGYSRGTDSRGDSSSRSAGGYSRGRSDRSSSPDTSASGDASSGGYTRSSRGDRGTYSDSQASRDTSSGSYGRTASRRSGGLDPSVAAGISRQAEDLALSYQRALGITATAQGVQMARSRYDQTDIDLLFALNDFVNAARLYGQLAPAVDDPGGQRQVVLALAREARRTDRIVSTSKSQAAAGLVSRWDSIRQDVLRLMDSQNLTAADIEEK